MIYLLSESNEFLGTFNNYGELVDYIHSIELARIRRSMVMEIEWNFPFVRGQEYWGFMVHTHESLKKTYSLMKGVPWTALELEAFYMGLDLIEIHYGDLDLPVQIVLTEGVDIGSLKKEWCLDYCKVHRCIVLEAQGNDGTVEGGGHDMAL